MNESLGPDEHYKLHEYSSYEEYKDIQEFHNKRKLKEVWADENTLSLICKHLVQEFKSTKELFGLCHGSRNGFEQNFLSEKLKSEVWETDISETATSFPNTFEWDFHDPREEWLGKCDFIYTNSWDQSWKPQTAMSTWLGQLKIGGLIFIEHTELHGPQGQSEMDPFGATPEFVPYLLSDWFGHQITIEVIHSTKQNKKNRKAWIFVLKKLQ